MESLNKKQIFPALDKEVVTLDGQKSGGGLWKLQIYFWQYFLWTCPLRCPHNGDARLKSNHKLTKDVLEFKLKTSLTFFCPGWAAGAWPGRTRTGCPALRPSWWHYRCPGWRRAPELSPEKRNKIKVQQERQRVLPAAAASQRTCTDVSGMSKVESPWSRCCSPLSPVPCDWRRLLRLGVPARLRTQLHSAPSVHPRNSTAHGALPCALKGQ